MVCVYVWWCVACRAAVAMQQVRMECACCVSISMCDDKLVRANKHGRRHACVEHIIYNVAYSMPYFSTRNPPLMRLVGIAFERGEPLRRGDRSRLLPFVKSTVSTAAASATGSGSGIHDAVHDSYRHDSHT